MHHGFILLLCNVVAYHVKSPFFIFFVIFHFSETLLKGNIGIFISPVTHFPKEKNVT